MPQHTYTATGIILKRTSVGEADRVVVLLTQEFGKIACVAKGVRKLSSSKRAFLEPGNYVKGFFVATKTLPLLTQASIIADCSQMQQTLAKFRQLTQLLEIYEKLFVEEELESKLFARALHLREIIVQNQASSKEVRSQLRALIMELGYQDPDDSTYESISEYIAALSDRPMRSFEFLTLAEYKK